MLHVLAFFSTLLGFALSACTVPQAPVSSPYPTQSFIESPGPNGTVTYKCPSGFYPYGNFGPGGPMVIELAESLTYTCIPATEKYFAKGTMETMLTMITCAQAPVATMCVFTRRPGGLQYAVPEGVENIKCPPGHKLELLTGDEIDSLGCSSGVTTAKLLNGTNLLVGDGAPMECVAGQPYTTTTAATTTTVKADSPASWSQVWNVNYYYNYGHGVHAFCADQTCINAIQKNGIGYDMNNGKGLMSRAVSESMINSVRASCPTGSKNLRNLGFTKSGKKYLHNLSGSGLKQGWVAIVKGACGATVPIKRWKSRYTDDMMYGVDLEWNTWYKGMVQDGGMPQFYMWA